MKKLIPFNICLLFIFLATSAKAQVWFPEGEYNLPQPPVAFTVDNQQIFTICKYYEDTTKSYWVVAKYEGRNWTNLPVLTLNKGAEVMNIKFYNGAVYVGGNFTFGSVYPSLVRFINNNWAPVTKFARANGQLPVTITALEVFNKKLIIGGNFNSVLSSKDSLPYLIAYDGTLFSSVFNNCKNCYPNAPVIDLAADDSLLAISGTFTNIKGRKSQYIFLHNVNEHFDTFVSTPAIIDRIAIKGGTVIGSGITTGKERKIYRLTGGIADLKFNFDSIIRVNEIVWFDKGFWINGLAYLKGNGGLKSTTLHLPVIGSAWEDFTNNYPGAKSIATGSLGLATLGKGALWAIGTAPKPLSIWNTNKSVVRFYPNSALVKVRVYLDSNNNCLQEKTERTLPKQLIRLTLPTVNRYAITNELGLAEFLFTPPITPNPLRFNIILARNYKASICAYDTIFKSFGKNYFDSIVFPINRRTNINDVKIIISAPKGTQVMKDKRTEYIVSCANVGSNIVSGFVKLKKNKHLASSDISPIAEYVPTLSNDSVVVWSYANLKPGETRLYKYSGVAYDSSFKDNTVLQAQGSASIAAAGNDYPDDDSDSIEQIIDNSVNPFRKDIYPIPNPGDSVSYLTMNNRQIRYNISFNNFGSSTVYNATITDTLDLNLDMSYIQETGSNKAYYTEIETDPNDYRGIIIWHFPNINLTANPSKNIEITTSGSYIGFKVVMNPLSNGYIVKNTAAVFFDNNYAGKTNTAYCTIVNTGIDDIRKNNNNGFLLYPNPANNLLNIKLSLNTSDKITIFNQQGAMVKSGIVTDKTDKYSMDIESLSNGIYMVQVIKGGQLFYSKFVKMQ